MFILKHHFKCHWCGGDIGHDDAWDVEHLIPRELLPDGEADRDANLAPIHKVPCHVAKTAFDRKLIAKSNRLRKSNGLDPITRKARPAMKGRAFAKGHQTIPSRPFPKRQT